MLEQYWTKLLVHVALLVMIGGSALPRAFGQRTAPNGALDGRLTDIHSTPLDNMTLTLRNAATGAEIRTTTTRGGKYHFEGLAQGEYMLIATGSRGTGNVDGIYIASGHQQRMQTAILLRPLQVHPSSAKVEAIAPREIYPHLAPVPFAVAEPLTSEPPILTIPALATNAISTLPLQPLPFSLAPSQTKTEAREASILKLPAKPLAQMSGLETATATSPHSIDATELQSLPLPGRNWQNFALDQPSETVETAGDRAPSPSREVAPELYLDGVSRKSAFAETRNGAVAESALRTVQPADIATGGMRSATTIASTERGGDSLHGQAFIFNHRDLWNARNPFTQWIRETAPATSTSVPAFTPQPFTASDREILWGAGVGGAVRKRHLFWFAALDGYERNNPGVATVKHPDHFFAEPSNDQMQLLSAQLGLSSANPVSAGLGAYSKLLESLSDLLGPVPRSSSQLTAFGRIDRRFAERHHLTIEATGAETTAPGGGFTRSSESYGNHSFGNVQANEQWASARLETFLTPNLLAVTQGSYGHNVRSATAETPSAFEQSLSINAWGRLPQIVVDSRYGFTIGNPSRFGPGSYPDERLTMVQEQLNYVRGNLLLKAGSEVRHSRDATSRLRNQAGTYYYASPENFASDALAFSAYGLSGQLDPLRQHNCDQTGRAWRDSAGVLHGLGYLPCYSWYSQTMGPADWWLSTNDWSSFFTSQWQPNRQIDLTLAMRWELEQLPPAISKLENPDLPLAAHLPSLGNQWGPRVGFAWGAGEGHWPVIRLGYGLYFSRTRNSLVENALTQTGSLKGDLNFFMRPTDNLNAGGAPPFPYVLAGEPASIVKPGAVEFAPTFRNGEVQQAEVSIGETLPGRIHLEASAVASLGRRLPVTFDANIDPAQYSKTITYAVVDGNASGPIKSSQITVPFFASWPSAISPTGFAGRLNPNYQQVSEIFSRANSTYEAAMLRLSRSARALTLHARYTYAHAMDWNPDETSQVSGPSVLDPIDFRQEYGTSALDMRHSATAAVIVQSPWKLKALAGYIGNGWTLSSTAYFRSGLPYTMHTAGSLAKEFTSTGAAIVALSTGMNGYGGDQRVYGVGRNTYRYPSTWRADLRLGKRFNLDRMRQIELMAESFNLFNHQNVTELETTGYSIESGTVTGGLPRLNFLTGLKSGQVEFGQPLNINATNFYRQRQIQFGARVRF